jgi:hypothetical protein
MKIEDIITLEHWGKVLSTSSFCFIVLTIKPMVLAVRMVS